MTPVEGDLTLAQARQAYFARNRLGDGGYDDAVVRVRFGLLAGRCAEHERAPARSAVARFAPTRSPATALIGGANAMIGAWGDRWRMRAGYAAAWALVLASFGLGVVWHPRATWRGFARGHGIGNLFTDHPNGETPELLATTLCAARARYRLDRMPQPAGMRTMLAFAAWARRRQDAADGALRRRDARPRDSAGSAAPGTAPLDDAVTDGPASRYRCARAAGAGAAASSARRSPAGWRASLQADVRTAGLPGP